MDPNVTLKEMLDLANRVLAQNEKGNPQHFDEDDYAAAADRMAELVEALDGWIMKGGFLPKRWQV